MIVAGTVVAAAPDPTDLSPASLQAPSLRSASGGLFTRPLRDVQVDTALSGERSLDVAAQDNLMYPREATFLQDCPAGTGLTALLIAPEWSASATAFPCADPAGAASALARISGDEASIGFEPVDRPPVNAGVYFRDDSPPTPTHPAQFHVRFVAGSWVVGLAIQARTVRAGRAAVRILIEALDRRYRPQ